MWHNRKEHPNGSTTNEDIVEKAQHEMSESVTSSIQLQRSRASKNLTLDCITEQFII